MANNYYGQVGLVSSANDYSPKEISLDLGKTFQIPKLECINLQMNL